MESLERMHALAEDQATRHFGAAPPPPWQPTRRAVASARWAWLGWAGAIVAGLAAGGWVLAQRRTPPAAPAPRLSSLPQASTVPGRTAKSAHDARVQRVAAEPQPAPAFRIESIDGVWRIRAVAAPRHEVARELAELSGTELRGTAGALRSARPLNLRWEGPSLAQAWQAVIGNEASYALLCRAGHCAAWIIDPASPGKETQAAAPRPAAVPSFVVATPTAFDPLRLERSAYD